MDRRQFLKYGAAVASAGIGARPSRALAAGDEACNICVVGVQVAADRAFTLRIGDLETELIDGLKVNQLGFRLASGSGTGAETVPGPILRVKEGSQVQITIEKDRDETHGFEIAGVSDAITEVAPGCTCTLNFTAPAAGTYIYHDAFGGTPLYRILGLYGVLVVEPRYGTTPGGSVTPHSLDQLGLRQRERISALFDAFGTTDRFPGGKWVPASMDSEYSYQEKIWVLSEIDPEFNALIERGKPIKTNATLTADVVGNFLPRYFTINNRSGFDLHEGDECVIRNYVGEPTLIRTVNAGLCHHANHIHGNHVFRLSQADLDVDTPDFGKVEIADNILELDTWAMWPMDRRDVLLPLEVPPDIPHKALVPGGPQQGQFDMMVAGQAQEPFPLRYVMHDHVEMATGLLVIDPLPDPGTTTVRAYAGGPAYDVEKFWVLDDIDPVWHVLAKDDHDAGLCGDDVGLNIFRPKYFTITGTPTRPGQGDYSTEGGRRAWTEDPNPPAQRQLLGSEAQDRRAQVRDHIGCSRAARDFGLSGL